MVAFVLTIYICCYRTNTLDNRLIMIYLMYFVDRFSMTYPIFQFTYSIHQFNINQPVILNISAQKLECQNSYTVFGIVSTHWQVEISDWNASMLVTSTGLLVRFGQIGLEMLQDVVQNVAIVAIIAIVVNLANVVKNGCWFMPNLLWQSMHQIF